eukprot:TRINITY_DN5735_c0_g1_i1.p1 TRINITY_DN5735_c0_g1~~TRINITY_DN5735_c0_g1_i1.p1  ORF type:complete len:250 (-),score=43.12 TRINITY_DN5735_c0_g1_i1:466-1215(-)
MSSTVVHGLPEWDNVDKCSTSKKRRLRASRLKQRLWLNSLNYSWTSPTYFPNSPPGMTCAAFEQMSFDTVATDDSVTPTTESDEAFSMQLAALNLEQEASNPFEHESGNIAAIASGLDGLLSELSHRLYTSASLIEFEPEDYLAEVDWQGLCDEERVLDHCDSGAADMSSIRFRMSELLGKLQSAADLAKAVELHTPFDPISPDVTLQVFLEVYYSLLDQLALKKGSSMKGSLMKTSWRELQISLDISL